MGQSTWANFRSNNIIKNPQAKVELREGLSLWHYG